MVAACAAIVRRKHYGCVAGIAFARALIVFMLVMVLPEIVVIAVQSALTEHHIPAPLFWANAVSVVLLLPPVQAFCTLVYLDAIGYEPSRS